MKVKKGKKKVNFNNFPTAEEVRKTADEFNYSVEKFIDVIKKQITLAAKNGSYGTTITLKDLKKYNVDDVQLNLIFQELAKLGYIGYVNSQHGYEIRWCG